MDKLRTFNLFMIAFLVALLVQYWFFPQQTKQPVLSDIYLSVEKENIVIPNIPKVMVHNTTSGAITVNPCQDVTISIDSRSLTGITELAKDFCEPLIVAPTSTKQLSFNPLYQVFSSQA